MSEKSPEKTQYNARIPHYTYYILCRMCKKVNAPDPPGLCSSCARKVEHIRDDYRPKPTAHKRTKRNAYKCGALPWVYRGRKEDHEMCHLTFRGYFISVRRQEDRRYCYIVGNKEESSFKKNITELTYARTRSVQHLAKIMGMTFEELVETIKNETKGAN